MRLSEPTRPTLPESLGLAGTGLKDKRQGTGPCQRLALPIQLSVLSSSLVTLILWACHWKVIYNLPRA